jgi:hypothetical protein
MPAVFDAHRAVAAVRDANVTIPVTAVFDAGGLLLPPVAALGLEIGKALSAAALGALRVVMSSLVLSARHALLTAATALDTLASATLSLRLTLTTSAATLRLSLTLASATALGFGLTATASLCLGLAVTVTATVTGLRCCRSGDSESRDTC